MVVPIIASISRDLFLTVPRELRDGATALGATRWEVVRGVVLPSTGSGLVAATFLGLGRALGEAIAVTQVIGAGSAIHASLFRTGDTLASRIADQYPGGHDKTADLLAVLPGRAAAGDRPAREPGAQVIIRRFDVQSDTDAMSDLLGAPEETRLHYSSDPRQRTRRHLGLSRDDARTPRDR